MTGADALRLIIVLMVQPVRGVLFDMDDTLFDHNTATARATAALHAIEPRFRAWPAEELRRRHSEMLEIIHQDVVSGRLQIDEARRERFRRLLLQADAGHADLERAPALARRYREEYEQGWGAVEGAGELLETLKARGVRVGIVTNNIRAEQMLKLDRCGLAGFVDVLVTSEDAGIAKPEPAIFGKALAALDLAAASTVMVGDVWDTDIAGALRAGLRPVWFNWRRLPARDPAVDEIVSFTPAAEALAVICRL
jgi:HAD superfamily hydrolase (TIGR01549 family)